MLKQVENKEIINKRRNLISGHRSSKAYIYFLRLLYSRVDFLPLDTDYLNILTINLLSFFQILCADTICLPLGWGIYLSSIDQIINMEC